MFNMTEREARQRCATNDCQLYKRDGEYIVVPNWLQGEAQERATYYTDDAEDAALTSGAMYKHYDTWRKSQ